MGQIFTHRGKFTPRGKLNAYKRGLKLPSMISLKKWELVLAIRLPKNTYFETFPDDINFLIIDQHKSVLFDQYHNKYKSYICLQSVS